MKKSAKNWQPQRVLEILNMSAVLVTLRKTSAVTALEILQINRG
jgi:hypothetical protein